jgi:hypothetical protein
MKKFPDRLCPMLFVLPIVVAAQAPMHDEKKAAPPVQEIEKIEVYGKIEPEDFRPKEKTPLQKLKEKLESSRNPIEFSVRDYTSGGTRKAQINTASGAFCLEERTGQIDFSGLGKGGNALMPSDGKTCK